MWSQITLANWAGTIAIIAFVVSASVFLFFVVGAIRTPRSKIDHDAALPLKKEKMK